MLAENATLETLPHTVNGWARQFGGTLVSRVERVASTRPFRLGRYSPIRAEPLAGGGKRGGRQGIGPGNGGPGRLFNTRGVDAVVREKVEAPFGDQEFSLERTFVGDQDPKHIEERPLRACLDDHCELPPANHSKRGVSNGV